MDTDACNVSVGCVLLREQPDKRTKRIGNWSASHIIAELVHDATQRECLAIVRALLYVQTYLDGSHFTISTDFVTFKWILSLLLSSGRPARQRLPLYKLDFDVVHRARLQHEAADALPRLRTDEEGTTNLDDSLSVIYVDNKQITDENLSYVHVCTEWNVMSEPTTEKRDEKPIQEEETSVRYDRRNA